MSDKHDLPEFEGRHIDASTMKLAGDCGPLGAYHLGETVTLVVRGRVDGVRHRVRTTKKDRLTLRDHSVTVEEAAVLPTDLDSDLIDEAFDEARRRREEAAGIQRLNFGSEDAFDDDDEVAELVPGEGP